MSNRWKLTGLLGALAGLAVLYYRWNPALFRFFPDCPFWVLTGAYCPGCGSQRAVHQLLHGHLRQAADYNLLLVITLPLLSYVLGVRTLDYLRNQHTVLPFLHSNVFTYGVLVLVLAFWLLRNLPVVPFTYLAP
ncbi:MAG: DUF2752 domain-containing protein [Ferruginibacter sp.]|nr:DUF2752 domain-containing protein [Cytophagales bacterium]